MKTRPKQRKSASNKSSIVKGFFKSNDSYLPHVKIGGIRNNQKISEILKKIK